MQGCPARTVVGCQLDRANKGRIQCRKRAAAPQTVDCTTESFPMNSGDAAHTTAAVQQYLDELAGVQGDSPAAPIIRGLLARAVGRLHMVCGTWLHRRYRRLADPPLNLQTEELL